MSQSDAIESLWLETIDKWLSSYTKRNTNPGLQIAIRKHGELIFSKAYGVTDTKTKKQLTTKHSFHIASHSKTFTTCAVLQLVDQGKLNLDSKVADILPVFKKHKDPRFKKITVRHLLSHRSGISRDGEDYGYWRLQRDFYTRAEVIKEILKPLICDVDTVTKYSNIAFSLLEPVIEAVTQQSYNEVIQKLVLNKLGKTSLVTDYSSSYPHPLCQGHVYSLVKEKEVPLKPFKADGMKCGTGFIGNAEDTSLFFSHFLQKNTFLKPQTYKLLKTFNKVLHTKSDFYGLGLTKSVINKNTFTGYSGGYLGFSTNTRRCEETPFVISIFTNSYTEFTFPFTRCFIELWHLLNKTFSSKEKATVSDVCQIPSGTFLYIVGKTKALQLNLGKLNLAEAALFLDRNKKAFYATKEPGMNRYGEPFHFTYNSKGKIQKVVNAKTTLQPVKEFERSLKKYSV